MAKRIGGERRKTRHKFKKDLRARGKISLAKYLCEFNEGDKVCLKADTSVQRGMYHRTFHGKIGVVKGKKGQCYKVLINDLGKEKIVIVHPVHLKIV